MANFKSVGTQQKIDRLFKVIDEDGNGSLSYDEIATIVSRSLSTYTRIWQTEEAKQDTNNANGSNAMGEMNTNMPAYFSRYIFDKIGVDLIDEITMD